MCGIAGIFSFNKNIPSHWIKLMTDTLKHRGPDDEGYLALNTKTGDISTFTGDGSIIEGQNINTFSKPANLFWNIDVFQ